MRAGQIIRIFQKIGNYEGWIEHSEKFVRVARVKNTVFPLTDILICENDRLNTMNFTFIKAGKMMKIFQKVGIYEG